MVTVTTANSPVPRSDEQSPGFRFVSNLARELSTGRVNLPSFPDVVVRVQRVLADELVSKERIARVVSSDAGLAARLLAMANSALLHRGTTQVTDLQVAITIIGSDHIRSVAMSYASVQLRLAPALAHIRDELERCWREAVHVAALAHAIAGETRRVRADEAMLTGLLHNIGKVYITARGPRDRPAGEPALGDALMRDWYPAIGKAVIENWQLSEDISTAVGGQLELDRSHRGLPDMQDLLIVAVHLAKHMGGGPIDDTALAAVPAAQSLGVTREALARIMIASQKDVELLQAALG